MATPIVLIDSATGSDSLASGAGPGTAITGSTGRTRNTASQLHFGFFGATDDFSAVTTDGSNVVYMAIATAGQRNFSSIAGIKNTRHTTTGNITSGAAILSALGSTSGWTIADVVKVAGAGAASADLYSTILTVDSSTQVTLNDNAGTTVTGAAVENPKQATLSTSQGVNTGTTDTAWAIGGKRASIGSSSSVKLFSNNSAAGDAMPGWIVQLQSGHSETIAATLILRRAGDSTTGPIILRGASGASTLPLLTFSNNGAAVQVNAGTGGVSGIIFRAFELQNSNATKTASIGINTGSSAGPGTLVDAVKINHATNKFWKGVTMTNANIHVFNSDIGNTANIGITLDPLLGVPKVIGCYIHDCGSHGISVPMTNGDFPYYIIRNVIYHNTGDGVNVAAMASGDRDQGCIVLDNAFDSNTSDGFEIAGTNARSLSVDILNNIFSNNSAYGLRFTTATQAQIDACGGLNSNNDFYNNTTGPYLPVAITDFSEQTLNPVFTNASGGDFSIGSNLKALGYMTAKVGTYSATQSYEDIGAAQRLEPLAAYPQVFR